MVRILKWILGSVLLTVMALVVIYISISKQAEADLYHTIDKVPAKKAALVLGTAKYMVGGGQNYFYTYRIRAAVDLFKAGKVKAIVVSGDNSTKYYNETSKMQKDLIKAGVPNRYITIDPFGLRTLDSVVRAEAIFDLKDYIIVSQKFHLERALFIAKSKGHKAIGFIAKDIPGTAAAYRMKAREYFARAKAFLDVYILHTMPKYDGKKEKVNYKQ
ncbi:YdcF family protein [Sulfurovum sp. XTW-4]|uniref:YdcF family protein n=1 Tax=Sulfurovum xiamenensis TaxID=3019066 RepID=A0ABT7QST2_9BACT|nr:ElyC/SanA/YdcF family protein [Sulfurovum xiamenensis]MDM5264136.1 YdcF family protein [Sulfurovum xiamenensis]